MVSGVHHASATDLEWHVDGAVAAVVEGGMLVERQAAAVVIAAGHILLEPFDNYSEQQHCYS